MTSAAVFLLLSVVIILFVFFYQRRLMRQKQHLHDMEREHQSGLLRAVLDAQENERRRVARDLHDEIGAVLSAVKLNIDLLARRAGKGELGREDFGDVGEAVGEAITDVRRISQDLLPPAVEQADLAAALRQFAEKVMGTTGMEVGVEVSGELVDMVPERRMMTYRIVQELTNNSLKHAGCKRISLALNYAPGMLALQYKDDGKGFDYAVEKEGSKSLGLKNIESRAVVLGGELEFWSVAGQGMQAHIHIPMD